MTLLSNKGFAVAANIPNNETMIRAICFENISKYLLKNRMGNNYVECIDGNNDSYSNVVGSRQFEPSRRLSRSLLVLTLNLSASPGSRVSAVSTLMLTVLSHSWSHLQSMVTANHDPVNLNCRTVLLADSLRMV